MNQESLNKIVKDGLRYRWLRDECDCERTPEYSYILEYPDAEEWDKVIDEGIAQYGFSNTY